MSPETKIDNKEKLNNVTIQINWIQSKHLLGEAFEYASRSEKPAIKTLNRLIK